ncbi:MAG: MATE family efflux transporter [Clostridiales bacterium]|jgi:putative MATE family efflux protein|nr:MATE family efflux transporter [Eubacteriales bacterium]MDH7565697.1 MATE family efflux transporter [Clostridiales bacterium]
MDNMQRLGEEKVSKLLRDFSIPSIVSMLVGALYNVIDRIFIGNSAGSLGIAGITIGFPIMMIQSALGMMVGIGATALLSIKLGQQKRDDAERIVGNTVTLLFIISIVMTTLGVFFLDPLLVLFGASGEVLPYARDYMRVILVGSIFMGYGMGMNNFIRAEGKPNISMATMLLGTILNAVFAPIFIFVFKWGMTGAALATVTAQGISTAWIILYFLTGKSILKIRRSNLRLRKEIVSGIFALGVSSLAMSVAQSVLSVIMNRSLLTYGGDIAISGVGVIMSLVTLIMMPNMGINTGAQPIIGFNYGARKFDRVKATLKYAIIATTVISTIGYIVMMLFPTQLISVFNSRDAELIAFGRRAIVYFIFFLPLLGFQMVGAGYFMAVGKPKQSIILSLSRQVLILIPALLILPIFFKLNGVLAAIPLSDLLATIITAVWLFVDLKRESRKSVESQGDGFPAMDFGPDPGFGPGGREGEPGPGFAPPGSEALPSANEQKAL